MTNCALMPAETQGASLDGTLVIEQFLTNTAEYDW